MKPARMGKGAVKAPRLTDWFVGVDPVNIGVYEVEPDAHSPWWSHWNGLNWGAMCESLEAAISVRRSYTHAGLKWRGLASDPAGEAK